MKRVKRIEEGFVGISLLVVTIILFVNIVLRYGFSANTNWAEELIRYVMIWITFIGAAICFRRSMHVGIDFFIEFVSKKWRAIIAIYVNIASSLFMIFLLYYGIELVKFGMDSAQITPSLQIKMYIIYMAIPIGAALSLMHLVINTYHHIKNLQSKSIEEKQI
ncbi:TRAP transporter small permease [Halalkalibacter okhensis]|uniref:2,3-diketo-L-gulonate TRAP transporter n=1 Tax=Halalkalibacter okhensis TaxID=333138 RepID=A0A0B0IDV0_9BACI|nr:TRAP transporter small permease [Halalkalibacter okhensis]KHF39465.1 2,3-diketo-L-gulonate TRAP transporter [Halalkalibacter okhensis]